MIYYTKLTSTDKIIEVKNSELSLEKLKVSKTEMGGL